MDVILTPFQANLIASLYILLVVYSLYIVFKHKDEYKLQIIWALAVVFIPVIGVLLVNGKKLVSRIA